VSRNVEAPANSSQQIEEFTDVYSFLFWQLGVKE